MLGGRNSFAKRNLLLFTAGLGVPALMSACSGSAGTDSPDGVEPSADAPSTVLAQYEGGFDGKNFWLRPMDTTDQGIGGASGDGIGQVSQAVLSNLPNARLNTGGAGGTAGAGGTTAQTNQVLLEQLELRTEANWNTAACGPTPQHGACARIRLINAYQNQDVFRSYFYLTSLTPPTDCTTGCSIQVWVPAPGASTQTSTSDTSLLGVTPASGNGGSPGVWRYGLLEHFAQEPRSPERWLAFVGTGNSSAGSWNFHFVAQVRGLLATPTRRGSLQDGTMDKSPFYNANGVAAGLMTTGSNIQATQPDGRYVVFSSGAGLNAAGMVSGTKVYRYDTTTGATVAINAANNSTAVPAGCSALNPSVSQNGNLVVFTSSGCDLGYGTTSRQVYLRNVTAQTTKLVTHAPGMPMVFGAGDSVTPRIAAGGGFITFTSTATNLFAGRPNPRSLYDVYRYNVASDSIDHPNIATAPSTWPNTTQYFPDISSDGARIVFQTQAQILVPGDRAVNSDIFLYDFNGAGVSALSVNRSGALQQSSQCILPTISTDGSTVAFLCATGASDAFVPSPAATAGRYHAYWRTVASASTMTMVDTTPTGTESAAAVGQIAPALNTNGQLIEYAGSAGNLLRTTGCNTPSGACMAVPAGVFSPFMRDMASPDPDVQRSFLVSLIRPKLGSNSLPFAAAPGGLANALNARAMDIVGTRDAATAVYYISGGNSADWGQDPSSGGYQVYLSPASDSIFQ